MMRYGYTIGVSKFRTFNHGPECLECQASQHEDVKFWRIPFVVSDEEIAEHVFAGGVTICNR